MRTRRCSIAVCMTLGVAAAEAQERSQGRSVVMSRHGIVAAEHPLAAQVGAQVLAAGGNAVDAAVATNAAMGVFSPAMNGIGGDLFALVYDARSKRLFGLNASGWAPLAHTPEYFAQKGLREMPGRGALSVTVPGAVDGWQKLVEKFGRKTLAELLQPALEYAEEGFPVTEWVAGGWEASAKTLAATPTAARTFLPGGRAPRTGDLFRNPDLAASLRRIASEGRAGFYAGETARRIVETVNAQGAGWTEADLVEHQAEWVEPISTTYRGWTVYEIPPNGQGIAALMMLNLMEGFALGEYGHNSMRALHAAIEAKKLAYADMLRYVADQRFAKVPVSGMLAKHYARERAAHIDASRAACAVAAGKPPAPGDDTTYLSSVDAEGNLVSLIQSNYSSFGSGLVPEGLGFALHNRGALFSLEADSPNRIAPRKRPLHTIIPAFMEKGEQRIAFGIMGGWNQSQAHAQFVSNLVDHGMNLQAAMEAARFNMEGFEGCEVAIERRVPEATRADLERLGHKLRVVGDYASRMGGGQAVMRDFATGVNFGASDPRKDGAAIPEPRRRPTSRETTAPAAEPGRPSGGNER